jgi:hypothetical protein
MPMYGHLSSLQTTTCPGHLALSASNKIQKSVI